MRGLPRFGGKTGGDGAECSASHFSKYLYGVRKAARTKTGKGARSPKRSDCHRSAGKDPYTELKPSEAVIIRPDVSFWCSPLVHPFQEPAGRSPPITSRLPISCNFCCWGSFVREAEAKTVTERIRVNTRESVTGYFDEFMKRASFEEQVLLLNVLVYHESRSLSAENTIAENYLASAFETEIGRNVCHLSVPEYMVDDVENYIKALRAIQKAA